MRILLSTTLLLAFNACVAAAPPSLVPSGWRQVLEPGHGARTFISPDGSGRVRFGHEAAHSGSSPDADGFAHRPGEQVTYEQRGSSWFVVSGYRGGEIFYRKGNLACGDSRWNLIEFRYP